MKSTNANHDERPHAEFGGSVAKRILNCTQSVLLSRKVPKSPPSPDALEGTRLHEVTEKELDKFFNYLRKGPKSGSLPYDYTELGEPLVIEIIEHVYETILEKQLTQKYIKLEQEIYVSKQFNMYGMADLIIVHTDSRGKRCGIIVDYKFGRHEVEGEDNPQLAFYAYGLLMHIRETCPGKDLDYVRCIILQPKVEESFKEVQYTTKQLESWGKKFLDAAHNIYVAKRYKYKVGEWCHFCPGKVICPKFVKDLEQKSGMELVNIRQVELPDPARLPFEQVEKMAFYADLFRSYLKRCEEVVSARIQKGKKGKFMKVVHGDSRRNWKPNTKSVIRGLKELGVEDATTPSLIGIGDATDKLIMTLDKYDEEGNRKTKKDLKAEAEDLLSDLTVKSKPGLSLVPLTHKKPAIRSALDVFSDERVNKKVKSL